MNIIILYHDLESERFLLNSNPYYLKLNQGDSSGIPYLWSVIIMKKRDDKKRN